LNLAGGGGGKAAYNGNVNTNFVPDFGPRWGAPGGGGGGCAATISGGTCTGTQTPGHGGGGVQIDVAGTITIGTASVIDTSGTNGTTNSVGGGGAGGILFRWGTGYTNNGTMTQNAGTGGSSCGSCCASTGCNTGGNGGGNIAVHVQIF
jgi:hypothetical protein